MFFGERPELVGREDVVTGRHRRVCLRIEVLAHAGWRSRSRSTGDECSPSASPTGRAESLSSVGPPLMVVRTGAPHSKTGLHPPTIGIEGHVVLVAVSIAIPCRRPRPPQTTPEASGEPSISLDVQDSVERDDLARFIHDEPEIGELVPGLVVVQQHRHV